MDYFILLNTLSLIYPIYFQPFYVSVSVCHPHSYMEKAAYGVRSRLLNGYVDKEVGEYILVQNINILVDDP